MTTNPHHSTATTEGQAANHNPGMELLSTLDAAEWNHVPASDTMPSYFVYTKAIKKPELDDMEYRIIRLENGLQAVLVHDAKADKAAATVNVSVGSAMDPVSQFYHFVRHAGCPYCGRNGFPFSTWASITPHVPCVGRRSGIFWSCTG